MKKNSYPPELRTKIACLAIDSDLSVRDVARESNIPYVTIFSWIKKERLRRSLLSATELSRMRKPKKDASVDDNTKEEIANTRPVISQELDDFSELMEEANCEVTLRKTAEDVDQELIETKYLALLRLQAILPTVRDSEKLSKVIHALNSFKNERGDNGDRLNPGKTWFDNITEVMIEKD
jgi:transposase-like protein